MRRTFLFLLLLGLAAVPRCVLAQASSYLGLELVDMDMARARQLHMNAPQGVQITKVQEGSPAERAGLRVGDVILTYNGDRILGAQQLKRLVSETLPGSKVPLGVSHESKHFTAVVTVGARSQSDQPSPDVWSPSSFDQQAFPSPVEIPFPLLIWRNTLLGIECEALQPQLADYFGVPKGGVLVRAVQRASLADGAGLHAGDVIVSLSDHATRSPRELTSILRTEWVPGRSLHLTLYRDHKRMNAAMTVPDDGQ